MDAPPPTILEPDGQVALSGPLTSSVLAAVRLRTTVGWLRYRSPATPTSAAESAALSAAPARGTRPRLASSMSAPVRESSATARVPTASSASFAGVTAPPASLAGVTAPFCSTVVPTLPARGAAAATSSMVAVERSDAEREAPGR